LDKKEVKKLDHCHGYGRSFLTRNEKIKCLEEYKEHLEHEAAGVAERIEDLKKQEN
jgi:hypothetical protein